MKRARPEADGTAEIESTMIAMLTECPEGLDPQEFADVGSPAAVTAAFNNLLAKNRVRVFVGGKDGSQQLCRLATEEWTQRFRLLTQEEKKIYYDIEASGRQGLWVRHIKDKYQNASQVAKAIKRMEDLHLIKQFFPWDAQTRKMYMLIDLQPLKSSVGACWLAMGQIDHDVLNVLQTALMKALSRRGPCTPAEALEEVVKQGILKMEVIEGEVRQLLKMLQYKGLLERYFDVSKGQEVFVLAPGQGLTMESPYTQVPCGVCPVAHECTPDGVISPATCKYYNEYLDF